jgi:ABC-type nitrate/sulfonate/bicarbonate transport system substrate-binding protein
MTLRSPRSALAPFVGFVALLLVASLGLVQARARSSPREITVGVSALRISAPLFLAEQRGLFARAGLRVRFRSYSTAQPMLDDLALGRLDAAGFVAWPIVLMASARASEPVRVTSEIVEDDAHRLSYVLVRRGSALRFPRDLEGRRVGVLPTIAYRRWLSAIGRAAGVDPGRVTVVGVEPSMQAQALEGGAVDMLFTNDPMATAMISRGIASLADDGPPCARRIGNPFSFGTFALSGSFARSSPADARALSSVVDEAIELSRRDAGATRDATRAWLRADERAYVDRYPVASYRTSRESAGALARAVSDARSLGIIDRAPNVRALAP